MEVCWKEHSPRECSWFEEFTIYICTKIGSRLPPTPARPGSNLESKGVWT